MPEDGAPAGGRAASAAPGDRHLFVYYKLASESLAAARPTVMRFQAAVRAGHPALQATLMRRPGDSDGLVTLMESYRLPAPLPAGLREQLAAGPASLQPWLRGERHVEEFVPCA